MMTSGTSDSIGHSPGIGRVRYVRHWYSTKAHLMDDCIRLVEWKNFPINND